MRRLSRASSLSKAPSQNNGAFPCLGLVQEEVSDQTTHSSHFHVTDRFHEAPGPLSELPAAESGLMHFVKNQHPEGEKIVKLVAD